MEMEESKLEAQMEYARYEHETELLRERMLNMFTCKNNQKFNAKRNNF
jgi:splicing factor, proline- and glutamine-rich